MMHSLTVEKDTLKNQEDCIGIKCTLVCFNVLSSALLDTKTINNKVIYFTGCSILTFLHRIHFKQKKLKLLP